MLGPPGAFKTCHPANITVSELPIKWENLPFQPIPVSRRTQVAAKRYYVRSKPGGSRFRTSIAVENQFAEQEINLLYWASSLHNLSNTHVKKYLLAHPDSDASQLELPETRMVYGGLFQHGPESGDKRRGLVILIEELVKDNEGNERGKGFVKFIGNSSPVPRQREGPAGVVARYLSFFQHLQYEKTGHRAFISDYQGAWTGATRDVSLTLAFSDLGPLFGDGNVCTSFEDFTLYHPCNVYCRAFGLKPLLVDISNDASKKRAQSPTSEPEFPSVADVIVEVLGNRSAKSGPAPLAANEPAPDSGTSALQDAPSTRKSRRLQDKSKKAGTNCK
ncbi:hypothetical protein CALVIDRAFT_490906 [Calocera viscosa TUFC12733]|uniref:Alpha-type protein kinase domain-containing protein n=1 Tax=Calocera viscosa (strain TUFC12733) TaxID=1330018 RepID=A0A167G4N5_CALVF|nr:hypothetical protein CALVIDRAFT_490906 [Calocera viscosa TUFC12733]